MADGGGYDVIIVGAGHNGLIASYYLARAGLRVGIFEARELIGGSCVTEELIPGFRFSTCANVVWSLRPKIVQDLQLYERGLQVDSRQFLRLLPDGRFLYSGRMTTTAPGESGESLQSQLARFSRADAEALPRWQSFLARLNRIFGPYLLQPPPHLHEIYSNCRDPADREALDLILTVPVSALYDQFFETDFLRDMAVPDEASGLVLALINALGSYSETGQPVPNGYIRGGMGTLTQLIAQAAQEQGVEIHTQQPIRRVLVKDGQAVGIELVTGERVYAKIVVATADPKRTFLTLCDPADLPAGFAQKVQRIRTDTGGASLKLHCALSELPDYQVQGALSQDELSRVTLIVAPNRSYREATWQAAQKGKCPTRQCLRVLCPAFMTPHWRLQANIPGRPMSCGCLCA